MERGKGSSTRGKPKNQHFPSDLYVLGAKSGGTETAKRPIATGPGERKREQKTIPIVGGKKAKLLPTPTPLGRPTTSSSPTIVSPGFELWETQAVDVEPADLVDNVLESCQANQHEKAVNLVLGSLKILKNTKWKPDSVLIVGLIYLAKMRSNLFCSELVTQALSFLLKRDPQHNFKSKGNPTVQVLAANLLARGYHDSKHWPTSFVKLYIEDAMGERIWVDQVECKGFVNNILTGFGTKLPPQNLNFLLPEMGPIGISRSDSPLTITTEEDEDNNGSAMDIPVMPRFTKCQESVEHIILDMQNNRRQTPESVTRNYLKLLASTAGMVEVRVFVMARLEMWLQNPKLMKPAQELLLSVCVNCSSNTPKDTHVIASVAKMRIKTKSMTNFYLACVRELINAHPENLSSVLKHTVYNELSNSRNPNNLPMIGVIFQTQPEESAVLLADIILELLFNRDDYLRSIRLLLREIVRALRYDINLLALCRGLMVDKRDNQTFRDFEFKDRMFNGIIDLLAHACFLGVSPAVKESVNLVARGDKREIQTLINFHTMVATIQQEAVIWLKDSAWKIYRPSPIDFAYSLRKIVFMEQQEAYYKIDMWPPESERSLIFRLVAESPLYETTLFTILMIGLSKDHSLNGPDALELADQLVKRTAGLTVDFLPMLLVTRQDLFDVVLKVVAYHHPDHLSLPTGYTPPKLAVANSYWKAWVMLLVLSAHNPATLGEPAWNKYPKLRMLMEMCITNYFTYPPPTMQINETSEEGKSQEARRNLTEREQIIEFESHLAAASTKGTKAVITEANSLLLHQLTAMDPLLPAREPPPAILEQLASLNTTHRLGHLLCRSRQPDFLLSLIQRQGASQSMPWLADLVENSESSLSHLPLQCLCEFLLTSGPPEKNSKGQQLVDHLQHVLKSPEHDASAPSEVMEYLLRRLSSQHMNSRIQAIKGLKLVLAEPEENLDLPAYLQENSWLLQHLPVLPHFKTMRPHVIAALRQACLMENDPGCIASYIHFLSIHTADDDVMAMGSLVHDMAQLIVERSTIMNAVMPDGGSQDSLRSNTHHSLMLIFYSFLEKARQPRGKSFQWNDSSEPVYVHWVSGEEASFHILVVHAMVILLCYGEGNDPQLYELMLNVWFPLEGEMPRAYLMETSEEAVLIPDWLKLRMVRSGVTRLVDAALVDLAPSQLLLFIQSFGISAATMTPLLETLDQHCRNQLVSGSFDAHYMTQLVSVQDRRGASGGKVFLESFGIPQQSFPVAFKKTIPKHTHEPMPSSLADITLCQIPMMVIYFGKIFSEKKPADRIENFVELERMFLLCTKSDNDKLFALTQIMKHLAAKIVTDESKNNFISNFLQTPFISCLAIRLIWSHISLLSKANQLELTGYLRAILGPMKTSNPLITGLQKMILTKSDEPPTCAKASIGVMLGTERKNIGQVIDYFVASEPELMNATTENEMRMVLFGQPVKSETAGGVMEECRPYLLTLLTHKASWGRLQTLVDHLLSKFEKFYSPSAVLDFLVAMTHNPRLWQGREKHVPKHQLHESVLNLTRDQVVCLVEYIIEEAAFKDRGLDKERPAFLDLLEARLPLLIESLCEEFYEPVVKRLASDEGNVCKHLLILLYFHVPGLIQFLIGTVQESLLKGAIISGWSSSTLDKVSHTLLTALTSSFTDAKDGLKRSNEFELAARKMAVVHPALVLRQLPMLAATLLGRVHFDYHVLRTRNHLNIFHQILGIIDLLQARIFDKIYRQPLHILLDSYLTLYKLHGTQKTVIHMLAKFIGFLQNYVVSEPAAATKYLQNNSQTLIAIQKRHPGLTSLRSLLSGVLTLREDAEETEGQSMAVVATPSELVVTAPPYILNALSRGQHEEIHTALQDLDHLSSRSPAILESVTEYITELLLSPYSNVRSLAHLLLVRLFKHNPQCNALTGYLRCLESGQGDVILSALEKLPEMVICSQENAVLLLEKAFSLSVRSNTFGTSAISKAITALNQQTGC